MTELRILVIGGIAENPSKFRTKKVRMSVTNQLSRKQCLDNIKKDWFGLCLPDHA